MRASTMLFLLASAAPAVAQAPAPFDWRLPIHRDASGETWAAGPSYKARFDDGMTFVPVVGSDADHRTWRWRTASVRVGGAELVAAAATPATAVRDGWRYELRWPGGVVETYDVRGDGVEQRFRLEHRPPSGGGGGDWIVTGGVAGLVAAAAPDFAPRALRFRDASGRDVVRYGEARAFDAAGRAAPVETRHEDGRVELRLGGDWLADARFPVVIDPLVATTQIPGTGAPEVVDLAVGSNDRLLLTATRAVSSSDWDLVAVELDGALNVVGTVLTDLTTLHSTRHAQCAFASVNTTFGQPERWLVAAQRDYARSGAAQVWVYAQDLGGAANSATWQRISGTGNAVQRYPSISGAYHAGIGVNKAVVVYQEDAGIPAQNTSASSVWKAELDPWAGTLSAPALVAAGGLTDNEWPSITKTGTSSSALVVWQRKLNSAGTDWDVVATFSHGLVGVLTLTGQGEHELRPVVAGSVNYTVAFTRRAILPSVPTPAGAGHAVDAQRVDSDPFHSTLTAGVRAEVARATGLDTLTTGGGVRGLGYDSLTDSHWTVAYTSIDGSLTGGGRRSTHGARLGGQALVIEAGDLELASATTEAFAPAVAFNHARQDFPIAWSSTAKSRSGSVYVAATRFEYRNALAIPFGNACGGTLSGINRQAGSAPHAGSAHYEVHLDGGTPNAPTALLIGVDTSLNLLLLPCGLLSVGPVPVVVTAGVADALGRFDVPTPLGDQLFGNVFLQTLQLVQRTGALRPSRGLALQIQ